jgi:carboxyl-terminal processing protease
VALLATYPDPESFRIAFNVDETVMSDLQEYAIKEGIEPDPDGLLRSRDLIELRLKALIARDLWDTSAYWQMINADNPVDRSFQKALEALQDNTHQRLGLVKP